MILFGWRKRIALSLSLCMFLGSISYLSGSINTWESNRNNNYISSNQYRNFLSGASILKIFSKPFKTYIVSNQEEQDSREKNFKSLDKKVFVSQLKKYIKKQVLEKLKLHHFEGVNKELEGYFLYRWIRENILLVVLKFKLDISGISNWYYDRFSVTLKI